MRIAIVMTHAKVHNHTGGATKLFFDMASELHFRGYTVDCYYSDTSDGKPIYGNTDRYQLINLKFRPSSQEKLIKLWRKLYRLPSKLKLLKVKADPLRAFYQKGIAQYLKKYENIGFYDLYIAFGYADATSLRYAGVDKDKILTMCHTDPSVVIPSLSEFEKNCWFDSLKVHCLLPSFEKHFAGVAKEKIICIPNPVTNRGLQADLSQKKMIYLARIERNKRQHLIIEAINKIDRSFLEGWEINLYGGYVSKSYKTEIESLIKKYGLNNIIKLKGITNTPEVQLLQTSINLFPSAFEGFGLGLAEAMSFGIPSIGFKTCSGVNELITDHQNGYLVENTDEFSAQIVRLMKDESLRVKLGSEAQTYAKQFDSTLIWDRWDQLIRTLVNVSDLQMSHLSVNKR